MNRRSLLSLVLGQGTQTPGKPPIEAPGSVTEGDSIPVTVHDKSDRVHVLNTRTKTWTSYRVTPGQQRALPLPSDAEARDVLILITGNKDGVNNGAIVEVRPK